MVRYIDAGESARLYVSDFVYEQMKNIPTEDVIKAIRCKECKHCRDNICGNYYGFGYGVEVKDDDFCSYLESKEDV